MAAREIAWGPREKNKLIGKEIDRIDGVEKASGYAKYTADINTPETLYAKLLTCTLPHAKITKLNIEPAKLVPGVRGVYVFNGEGAEVNWDGTLIAAVAADRPEFADDGIRAIEVEYERLDFWVDEEDLVGAEAAGRTKKPQDNAQGDFADAVKTAAHVHKGYYGIPTISHMCLEPHGSHCQFTPDGGLEVHLSTQNVSGTAGQISQPLQMEQAKVTVICDYIGGGFGSKFSAGEWGVACAELAKQTGKPVRLMLDRPTELKIAGTRPSAFADVTIAADTDGKIIAWDSHHWGTDGIRGGIVRLDLMPYCFDFANRSRMATGISCNTGPNAAWRAPHHPQLCAISQTAMDDLAGKMGADSYEFFLKNLDLLSVGTPDQREQMKQIYIDEMAVGAELIGWKKKWHPHGKGKSNGSVKQGLGMALHTWGGRAGPSKCTLKIHPDGTVETFQGSQDLGTGTRTIIAITVAETFGLPVSAIKVQLGTNKYPPANPSGGSTTVGGISGPNRRAALEALWKIYDLVAARYKVDADSLEARDAKIFSNGNEVCSWKQACSLVGMVPMEVSGEGPKDDGLTSDTVGGVQMVDVSVDTETGKVRINKYVAVQDCGLILDLKTAKSQVYGAAIMCIAYALTEERIMDNATGRYINADMVNYKLPRIGDIGELVVEMYQPDSQYKRGVIGLGEPPVISGGAAISNAVANALGVRVPVLPLTPKRVLDALRGAQV